MAYTLILPEFFPILDKDPMDTIRIRGARTYNLKNIDLDPPRDRLIVPAGTSGSGKSSFGW